ncbi:MAG: alpha/beta hydrolase [Actinobacteria bacterium]|nr:alpha/beta hydrolase [Actinomycetota bacterium]
MRSIAVNGVDLIVHECGDPAAPTVLLLHGFPDLAHCWRHQMAPLAAAGFHVLAPNQRGYGHSSAPATVDAYGIDYLAGDLFALLDHYHKDDAVFVGHDWGAMVTWDAARLQPERVRAIAAVSVPYVEWRSPPTELFKAVFGDRFFYMLYFQQVGPPEAELGADPLATMARMLYGASAHGAVNRIRPSEPAPMEGTGFLTLMTEPPSLPFNGPEGPWLTAADLDVYADEFEHSGFFGPVSWYRNLDANSVRLTGLGAARLTMPCYLIWGEYDLVKAMDPKGPARMQSELPDFRGTTELAGVGHWVQQEAPNAFNEALLGFLRSL